MKIATGLLCALGLFLGRSASAEMISGESERSAAIEFKLGGYQPSVDHEAGLFGTPFKEFFGDRPMLLFQLEGERMLWQQVGSFGVGASIGYSELYAKSLVAATGERSSESSGFKVMPLRALATYRFDYPALHMGIPLVPYVKGGLAYSVWWATKGSDTQGQGGQWGYTAIGGLAFMLDFLEPRLAKDFDSDLGVNHSYLFAEYVYEDINNFGRGGLDLSSRHFMFGLTLEF